VLELALGQLCRRDGLDGARVVVSLRTLEPLEPGVHAAPARAHEIDEESEIVDARMPLRQEVSLDPLEAADGLVEEAADLSDVPRDGEHLGPYAVAHRCADVLRYRRLELRGGHREGLDLVPRPLESGLDRRRLRPARGRVGDALLGTLECEGVHRWRGYSQRRMDTALLDYDLPTELIAQTPVEPRDASRLLVYRRGSGAVEHRAFAELPSLLDGELVVVNDTRVVPARLNLRRETGAAVEVLLVERLAENGTWEALVRPSKRLRPGENLGPVRLREALGAGRWLVELEGEPGGEMPLPPYINEPLADTERYQTVFGSVEGSAAAPTAGLHLTPTLLHALDPVRVTLHVGLDTFRPVTEARLDEHELHGERYAVTEEAWERIAAAERVLALGTTTARVLETVARSGELAGRTTLFITPGFRFERVDALLTNFHLPRSTLLALVMAFVGVDEARALYREAVAEEYRFYSFGDAMLAR
jgi:S-adenosylmethionine:tRNA ribosyltransferase-isomerase